MQFDKIIEQTGGKFFGVTFVKNDGTIREMQARTGVTKGVKGTAGPKTAKQNEYLTVYDVQKQGYRNIARDRILSVRFEGAEIYKRQA